MFKVGDLAVYPSQGVGVIESIETREISGSCQNFYIMKILGNGVIIMIPTENAGVVGLRDIIDTKEVPKVYEILKERKVEIYNNQTWNRRYREYMDKIKTGSVFEVAAVLRDLYTLKLDKELCFGERKILDTAKSLLVKELSIAKNMAEEQIQKDIEGILKS